MKKIIAAAAVATMFAGAAFADISFSYMGNNYFKSAGGNLDYADRSDCMGLTISNDTAGATVDFDTALDNGAIKLVQDSYYGWMNFGLPVGNLQVTAGVWNGRYVSRVKTDAGDLDNEDFELYKPGVINGLVAKDSDNLTNGKISMVAAYTLADTLPGTLMVKAGLVSNKWNPDAKTATIKSSDGGMEDDGKDVKDSDPTLSAGIVGEVAYLQKDLINANLAVRYLDKKSVSIGAFVSPLMVEKLQATVGFTYGMVNNYDKYNSSNGTDSEWSNGASEYAVDLRARYQINDVLSVTTMHNLSSYAYLPSGTEVKKDREYGDNTLLLWDMVNVSYKMAENLTAGFTLNATFDNLDSDHVFTGADLITSPYLAIKATEKCAVTTSLRIATTGLNPKIDGHEKMDVTVPVIFSFNY